MAKCISGLKVSVPRWYSAEVARQPLAARVARWPRLRQRAPPRQASWTSRGPLVHFRQTLLS
eukprot:14271711-Alexandrium_andersonii.AAC.1